MPAAAEQAGGLLKEQTPSTSGRALEQSQDVPAAKAVALDAPEQEARPPSWPKRIVLFVYDQICEHW